MNDQDDVVGELNIEDFQIFPWHPSFNTGNGIIDSQHRNLVNLLNRLAYNLIENDGMEIEGAYQEIHDYAKVHFHDEELVWRKYFHDDPWFFGHKKSHEKFSLEIEKIRSESDNRTSVEEIEEVVKFLIRWLASHIIESDKKMYFAVSSIENGNSIEIAKHDAELKMGGEIRDLIDAVLSMYENLSKTTLDMIQERNSRIQTELMLKEAYKKLEVISVTDQLTGLFNRYHLDDVIEREVARSARNKERVALYMIDIDYFKKYNDYYGHLAGDEALKKVADVLRSCCKRPGDYLFRYGGEEFCVVIMQAKEENVISFGDKIRVAIESQSIPHESRPVYKYITVSIGAVTWVPQVYEKLKDYISRADQALYDSKKSGRNTTTLYKWK